MYEASKIVKPKRKAKVTLIPTPPGVKPSSPERYVIDQLLRELRKLTHSQENMTEELEQLKRQLANRTGALEDINARVDAVKKAIHELAATWSLTIGDDEPESPAELLPF